LLHRKQQVATLFASLKGKARVIVVTEGVAAVSFQWYASYLPLYMLALGVSEAQVGVLAGALVLTKFVSTLLGGYFADRFGRKRILVTVDILRGDLFDRHAQGSIASIGHLPAALYLGTCDDGHDRLVCGTDADQACLG